jgi:outer membrane protein OmpA-like peptidoglycan-associated protein/tetratricopeptide (TPR) repeat protein
MKNLFLVCLAFLAMNAAAQDEESARKRVEKYPNTKPGKKLKLAKQLAKEGSYYNAAEYYADVLKAKPDKIKVIHELAEINRSLRDYKEAEKYYTLEIEKVKDKWPNSKFFLGQMQKMNGKYDDAKKTFQEYLKYKLDKNDISFKSLAKSEIIGCDSAQAWLANPNKIKVTHEEGFINNVLTDFSPKPISGNRLLYSSLKSDTAINITKSTDDYYAKMFIATRDGKNWKDDTKLSSPPNDSKAHVGNGIFSADEKTLYYTKCDQSEIVRMRCRLFKSTLDGSEWGNPEELKSLNTPTGTTTQPTIGLDKDGNDVIYFVSDRGGKGGLDIFYAQINQDGTFGPVKNVGSEVNTAGDEFSPFYDKNTKRLYFSSNGLPGLGGFDIFQVNGAPENWGIPYNLGAPANSSADDMYFVLDNQGKKGFLASNRQGTKTIRGETCCDDIWSVTLKEEVVLKGIYALRTDPAQTPIDGVEASLYKVDGKNFDFVGSTVTAGGAPFYYNLKRGDKFKINGNKEGYWPAVENIIVKEDEERDTIYQVFFIDKIEKKKIKIENIYFEFDRSNVIAFYQLKLDSVHSVLTQNLGYSVEVQGHTDSKGSDEYNNRLSQNRADEAKAYLVSKGINVERVISKGYGETTPIAPNEVDGVDNPEGRARNRRVEFKIIPDKPEEAPEIQYEKSEPVPATKTGPGFTK